jgi:DNA-directed RNA polymerase alpha subunit
MRTPTSAACAIGLWVSVASGVGSPEEILAAHEGRYRSGKRGPEGVENMEPKPDLRPVVRALGPLSTRARRCIENAKIRSAMDLAYWSRDALSRIWGSGKLTVQEIVDAAASAGVHIAPDDAPLPWVVDPERWR